MKHCPECRQEYEDFVEVCAGCQKGLQPGRAPIDPEEDAEPEPEPEGGTIWPNKILVSLDLPTALALVDRMRENEIHAIVPDANTTVLDPFWKGGGNCLSYQVMVPEAEFERAMAIWREFAAEDESALAEEASKDGEGDGP